ncbi:MAG: hypothetical protein GY717_02560 [Rhodobacteraceae bacterium]|nr:hypothetical protein [Paracoccaceae bacterium]
MHTDQLGSVRLITDSSSARVTRRAYKPFGEITRENTWSILHPPEDKG